jgi:hypothetical protein
MASDPFRFEITLLPYMYSEIGRPDVLVFVDIDRPSPDAGYMYAGTARLLWGRGVDGEMIPGDFKERFVRVGKPIKWVEYYRGGMNRAITMKQLQEARIKAIKRKILSLGPEDLK